MNLQQELADYLDGQPITSANIGGVRRLCFVPWDSEWNKIVRDETAARENKERKHGTDKDLPATGRD